MKKEGYYLIIGIVLLNVLVIVLFSLNNPFTDPYYFFIRLFSLLGLIAMFVSSILTAYMRELYQIFKKPFIKIHHSTTIFGLVTITLHPIIFAINRMVDSNFVDGLKVFIPDFSSAFNFWLLAGRPALILIYIALIGVLIRKGLKKGWRWIHGLNYFALIFGVVHGIMIGTDFYNFISPIDVKKLIMSILFLLLISITIFTFTMKRIQMYKRKKRKVETEDKGDNDNQSEGGEEENKKHITKNNLEK